jgi:hypothetical protein
MTLPYCNAGDSSIPKRSRGLTQEVAPRPTNTHGFLILGYPLSLIRPLPLPGGVFLCTKVPLVSSPGYYLSTTLSVPSTDVRFPLYVKRFPIFTAMKFRFHRGDFNESMATTVEVDSIQKLAEVIKATPEKIRITPYSGVDSRNGWDTHLVEVFERYKPGEWATVGLSDSLNF